MLFRSCMNLHTLSCCECRTKMKFGNWYTANKYPRVLWLVINTESRRSICKAKVINVVHHLTGCSRGRSMAFWTSSVLPKHFTGPSLITLPIRRSVEASLKGMHRVFTHQNDDFDELKYEGAISNTILVARHSP